MNRLTKSVFTLLMVTFTVACSEVSFQTLPSNTCVEANTAFGNGSCDPGGTFNTFNFGFTSGKVDILFVVDNSQSMSTEQAEMANRFTGFINSLGNVDYQIAVTTTDVSGVAPLFGEGAATAANGNGAFRDGKLVTFPNGAKFLTNATSNKQSLFEQTVKRNETLACDNGNSSMCPSQHERGIFAANLAVEMAATRGNIGADKFFRPGADFAVIFLSDENELSTGGTYSPLMARDLPETLVQFVGNYLGSSKIMSAYSIIVRPGDFFCNTQQQNQVPTTNALFGELYAQLSSPNSALKSLGNLENGYTGNICASNYTSELSAIAQQIRGLELVDLACSPENPADLQISVNGQLLNSNQYTVDAQNRAVFNTPVQAGSQVQVSYKCPSSI